MISGLLLGGLVPMVLFYKTCTQSIHNCFNSFVNTVNDLMTLYFSTLLNTMDENRNNIIVLSFSPIIAFYKLVVLGYHYLHSLYLYNSNSNVNMLTNEYIVNYTLHGKDYSILVPKSKHYSHNQLLEATGYYTEEVVEEVDQIEEDKSETEVDQSDQGESVEDQSEQSESVEDQSEPIEDQSEPIEDQSEPIEDLSEQSESVEDQSEPVEEPKIVQVQREIDIVDSLHRFLGPYNNFHNSMVCITPDILGFDSIKVRYINEDFDEVVKEFSKDDVLHF